MKKKQRRLVDIAGALMAVRINGVWVCAFGGLFSDENVRDMNALAAGEVDAITLAGIAVVRA